MGDVRLRFPPNEADDVTIAADLIQDPNGDPNLAQSFRAPRLG